MYRDFFKLSGKPFQLSPDARFFFPSNEHKRALSFLQYGLSQADGFIVVTGDVGTGKSTLVQALLSDLDADEMLFLYQKLVSDSDIKIIQSDEKARVKIAGQHFSLYPFKSSKQELISPEQVVLH